MPSLHELAAEIISHQKQPPTREAVHHALALNVSARKQFLGVKMYGAWKGWTPVVNASSSVPKILVVDDDPSVRTAVAGFLCSQGYDVLEAEDGVSMRRALGSNDVTIVLLDVMLPVEDGLSLARELRGRSDIGVIMLSARGREADRVAGLEMGADDYLSKPASPRELLARVRAVLRRYSDRAHPPVAGLGYTFDGWTLDPVRRVLRNPEGLLISLSEGEFELLLAFVENPGVVLSRDELLELARGDHSEAYDRAVDVQVSRLRRKLEGCREGEAIRTVRGEGYLFDATVVRS
jgi:two-component system, OmpR family, response regulator